MDGTAGKPEDLRARVREGTRIEVGMIALDLFAEKGFERTTAGEAADAAGISRASFFRLFSSKEEAVFARQEATGAVIAATLAERPPEEDDWSALQSAFKASTDRYLEDPDRALARSRLILENPSLRARRLEVHANWSPAICAALASRSGGDAESIKIEGVVAAALGAFDAATTRWGASDGGDLIALIDESFEAVAALFAR
ncbi:MAG TPA: TetR family transcriptional regulator [Solirubrobacterales bacterium]